MSDLIYDLKGCRGRHIQVFDDKVILSVKAGVGSFLTGNVIDGQKTIYYTDCIGIQFKKSGLVIGYLQMETSSATMNNKESNLYNENTFTWETTQQSNKKMEEVRKYIEERVNYYKNPHNFSKAAYSSADEIKKYKELLDMGVITQEEFESKKNQLLSL